MAGTGAVSTADPAVSRRQGMRVGAAFSAALDPSRPPLFSDLGELELLPEEVWHSSAVPRHEPSSQARCLANRALCTDSTHESVSVRDI